MYSDLPHIHLPKLVSWLMLAFVLCRDVPVLFQKASLVTGSTCLGSEKKNLLRLAPESIQQLEEFVTLFFSGLPCTTIICVNLLGSPCATFLQELLSFPSCVHAWILVSRLNSKSQPIVMLLPVDSVLEGNSDDVTSSGSVSVSEGKVGKHWCCPWGSTVVDRVAPEFRMILEESYLSSSIEEEEDTKENRTLWWTCRKKLDDRLCKLLKNLEDSVGSIFATLEKNYHQDQLASNTMKPGDLSHAFCQEASFPLIDPLDAFYLLNPGSDLGTTQIEFEKWFRDQNLEG